MMFNKKEIRAMSHETLKEFIQSKLNPNETFDKTPLFWILRADNFTVEILKFLLKNNVDLNTQNKYGEAMVEKLWESEKFTFEMLKILVENNFDLNCEDMVGYTPLCMLFHSKNFTFEMLTFLVENNVDLSIRSRNGCTALHDLCCASNTLTPEMLKFLLEKQKDGLNIRNNYDQTPLNLLLTARFFLRTDQPSLEMLELLLPNKDLFDEKTINLLVEKNRPAMSLMLMCHGYFPTIPFLPQTNLGIVANILQHGQESEKENLMLFLQNKSSPGELLKANYRFLPEDSRKMIKTALCSATFFAQKSQKKWPKPVLMNILSQSLNTVDWLHVDQRNENEITEKWSAISQLKF